MKDVNADGYVLLAEAIIKTAMLDYKRAVNKYRKNSEDYQAEMTIHECEKFFLRDVDFYMLGDRIAGPVTLKIIQERLFGKCIERGEKG